MSSGAAQKVSFRLTPSPETVAGPEVVSPPVLAGVPEWVTVRDLYDRSPGHEPKARARWAQRRAKAIRGATAGRDARVNRDSGRPVWQVRSSVEWYAGRTVRELVAPESATLPMPIQKPAGWDEWRDTDKNRSVVSGQVDRWWRALKAEFPRLNDEQIFPLFRERHATKLEAAGLKCKSLTTIYRYRRRTDPKNDAYDGNADGRRARGDGQAGPPGSEAFRNYLTHVFLMKYRAAKHTLKPAWKIACGWGVQQGEEVATYAAVRRWANRIWPEPVRAFYRGERRWLREQVESVRRDKSQFRPGEMWCGDWHRLDFLATHNGKPVRLWLCVWGDAATGLIVSHSLAVRPTSDELVMSYGDGVLKWGAPVGMLIDNGLDYKSYQLTGGKRLSERGGARVVGKRLSGDLAERVVSVCEETETVPHFCWPFNPGSKWVESWFKQLCTRVSMLFESYCGNKPENRPETLYADLKARRIHVPTLNEPREVIGPWVENVWNREPKDALGGRSPIEAFAQDNPVAKRTLPEHQLHHKLMPRRIVTVGRGGTVRLDGVKYGQGLIKSTSALFDRQRQQVQIRYDRDRSRVFVHELDGRFICEARDERLHGVTDADVKELRRRQKAARKHCRDALPNRGFAHADLTVQAMVRGQERFVEEQTKNRKAVGAELLSERPLHLLPNAHHAPDAPRSGGSDRKDAAGPPDALPSLAFEDDLAEHGGSAGLRFDFGPEDDDTPREATVGDLLGRLEFNEDD